MTVTLILFVVCVLVGGVSAWRGARPPDFRRGPRMAPWRFLMILAGATGVMLLVHLAHLAGGPIGR